MSESAIPYLDGARRHEGSMPQLISRLRKSLTPTQAQEVVKLTELRRRAESKFHRASKMFFTEVGLQQATDERTAAYKSSTFPAGLVADLCCGIGGDLLALAEHHPTVAVDLCDRHARFALRNCQLAERSQVSVVRMPAEQISLAEFSAWHIDPDRRPSQTRTSQLLHSEPGQKFIEQALEMNPHAGIKLAPAAEIPVAWLPQAESEWIGERDECRQLFLRFGKLAQMPGRRTATLVDTHGQLAGRIIGGDESGDIVDKVQRLVHEPHACVRAARLVDSLAARHALSRISATTPYLTGDHSTDDPLLSTFEVQDVLPFDLRKLKQLIRKRGWGQLEIKKRGCDVQPDRLRQQLRTSGQQKGVILLTPHHGKIIAILAQRSS